MSKKQNPKLKTTHTAEKVTPTQTPTQTPPADTEDSEVTKDLKKKEPPLKSTVETRRAAADEHIADGRYGDAIQTLFPRST